ncbi:hypothetical protein M9Y10_024722 [Tritrichomonas musculus]|uniref:Protein kinase domain-containing protein n=1 Tax=Tritrichomonas musculus TaxID=1915356 RepID=A0ABR2HC07_9EUKA
MTMKDEDYVELRDIGIGSSFVCSLIYHILQGKLFVIKKPNGDTSEHKKLIKRERDNYQKFIHPFLPTFYGTIEDKNCIVIEFIKGQALNHINQIELTADDAFNIIFDIFIVIQYFHNNGFIYRDLKVNNIIIDESKRAVLIDLDRLIEYDPNIEQTSDLSLSITGDGKHSFDTDIYHVGETIKYILDETKQIFYTTKESDIIDKYLKINKMIELCYKKNQSISDIIDKFISLFKSEIGNDPTSSKSQFILGIFYYNRNFSISDRKKGIMYIILASRSGNRQANFAHGYLLHEGKNVKRNINEAIHYYKEASSFNNEFAKNNLGILYKHGNEEEIPQRIGLLIEYFEEAIRQKNDYLSMYNLSLIYFYDQTIKQDINKIIDLLIKSSKQFSESIILLCLILIQGYGTNLKRIKNEIKKRANVSNDLLFQIDIIIQIFNLFNKTSYDIIYEKYRERDYLYNVIGKPVLTSSLFQNDKEEYRLKYPNMKELSPEFYEGFGHDLL